MTTPSSLPPVLRFLTVGVANTAVGLMVIYVGKYYFGLGDLLANALGYGIGIATSFALNKRWTFEHRGSGVSAFFRFSAVLAIAYLLNLLTVVLVIQHGVHPDLAHGLGVIPYTLFSYWGSRRFAFRAPITLASPGSAGRAS